ncbi:helicase associated domain-containing protein [Streptomyces sp. SBR177]
MEAAVDHIREHGELKVPFTYRVPEVEEAEAVGWPGLLANFPLGQWGSPTLAGSYARGDMDEDRIAQLEKLGSDLVSAYDVAWRKASRPRCGRPPNTGTSWPRLRRHAPGLQGRHLAEERAGRRPARRWEPEQRQAEGPPVQSWSGALSQERREQLEDIDPSWRPAWPVEWQRRLPPRPAPPRGALAARCPSSPAAGWIHQGEDPDAACAACAWLGQAHHRAAM